MSFFVYLLISRKGKKIYTYVGYAKNVSERLKLHNSSKGAKFTKGNKWFLIYKKSYTSKKLAMIEEYRLKKNYKKRKENKEKYLENENFDTITF